MVEERSSGIIFSWKRHRVFYYALVARVLLAVRLVPPVWQTYLYENASVGSIVSNPWWTIDSVKEWLTDMAWDKSDEKGYLAEALWLAVEWKDTTALPLKSIGALALTTADYWIAHLLSEIAFRSKTPDAEHALAKKMPKSIRPSAAILSAFPSHELLSALLPLLYFANPAVILSSAVYGCFSNIKLLCLVIAINYFQKLATVPWVSCIALAAAMYLDVSFGVFGIALPGVWDQMMIVYSALQVLSYVSTGNLQIHGLPTVEMTSIPPSLSVLWYAHMEFFTRFAPYLRLLLGYLPYIVFVPLAVRLHRYPMVMVATFWTIVHTLCKPVSTLTDFFIAIFFMLLSPASCARMNPAVVVVAVVGAGVTVTLYVVLHPMWLISNVGEANFIFFQCLAYQVFVANVGLQFVAASLQRDKALRLTEKEGGDSTTTDTQAATGSSHKRNQNIGGEK